MLAKLVSHRMLQQMWDEKELGANVGRIDLESRLETSHDALQVGLKFSRASLPQQRF